MSLSVKHSLGLLAGELRVDISGLSDDQLDAVAQRFLAEDKVTGDVLRSIVEDVRSADPGSASAPTGGASGSPASARSPGAPSRKFRFNATEQTEAKYKRRLARAHRTEDNRTGLRLVPRRPVVLNPWAIHPPCKAAAEEGATPCVRCLPLTHPGGCVCDPCVEWWERVDG